MERLITVKAMRERYGCSNPTARKYLRQCVPHMESPLAAPEWAVREWEQSRMVIPQTVSRKKRAEIVHRNEQGRIIISRHR